MKKTALCLALCLCALALFGCRNGGAEPEQYLYTTVLRYSGEDTPLYEMNRMDLPVEIDPAGYCISVDKNYLDIHGIKAFDGSWRSVRRICP